MADVIVRPPDRLSPAMAGIDIASECGVSPSEYGGGSVDRGRGHDDSHEGQSRQQRFRSHSAAASDDLCGSEPEDIVERTRQRVREVKERERLQRLREQEDKERRHQEMDMQHQARLKKVEADRRREKSLRRRHEEAKKAQEEEERRQAEDKRKKAEERQRALQKQTQARLKAEKEKRIKEKQEQDEREAEERRHKEEESAQKAAQALEAAKKRLAHQRRHKTDTDSVEALDKEYEHDVDQEKRGEELQKKAQDRIRQRLEAKRRQEEEQRARVELNHREKDERANEAAKELEERRHRAAERAAERIRKEKAEQEKARRAKLEAERIAKERKEKYKNPHLIAELKANEGPATSLAEEQRRARQMKRREEQEKLKKWAEQKDREESKDMDNIGAGGPVEANQGQRGRGVGRPGRPPLAPSSAASRADGGRGAGSTCVSAQPTPVERSRSVGNSSTRSGSGSVAGSAVGESDHDEGPVLEPLPMESDVEEGASADEGDDCQSDPGIDVAIASHGHASCVGEEASDAKLVDEQCQSGPDDGNRPPSVRGLTCAVMPDCPGPADAQLDAQGSDGNTAQEDHCEEAEEDEMVELHNSNRLIPFTAGSEELQDQARCEGEQQYPEGDNEEHGQRTNEDAEDQIQDGEQQEPSEVDEEEHGPEPNQSPQQLAVAAAEEAQAAQRRLANLGVMSALTTGRPPPIPQSARSSADARPTSNCSSRCAVGQEPLSRRDSARAAAGLVDCADDSASMEPSRECDERADLLRSASGLSPADEKEALDIIRSASGFAFSPDVEPEEPEAAEVDDDVKQDHSPDEVRPVGSDSADGPHASGDLDRDARDAVDDTGCSVSVEQSGEQQSSGREGASGIHGYAAKEEALEEAEDMEGSEARLEEARGVCNATSTSRGEHRSASQTEVEAEAAAAEEAAPQLCGEDDVIGDEAGTDTHAEFATGVEVACLASTEAEAHAEALGSAGVEQAKQAEAPVNALSEGDATEGAEEPQEAFPTDAFMDADATADAEDLETPQVEHVGDTAVEDDANAIAEASEDLQARFPSDAVVEDDANADAGDFEYQQMDDAGDALVENDAHAEPEPLEDPHVWVGGEAVVDDDAHAKSEALDGSYVGDEGGVAYAEADALEGLQVGFARDAVVEDDAHAETECLEDSQLGVGGEAVVDNDAHAGAEALEDSQVRVAGDVEDDARAETEPLEGSQVGAAGDFPEDVAHAGAEALEDSQVGVAVDVEVQDVHAEAEDAAFIEPEARAIAASLDAPRSGAADQDDVEDRIADAMAVAAVADAELFLDTDMASLDQMQADDLETGCEADALEAQQRMQLEDARELEDVGACDDAAAALEPEAIRSVEPPDPLCDSTMLASPAQSLEADAGGIGCCTEVTVAPAVEAGYEDDSEDMIDDTPGDAEVDCAVRGVVAVQDAEANGNEEEEEIFAEHHDETQQPEEEGLLPGDSDVEDAALDKMDERDAELGGPELLIEGIGSWRAETPKKSPSANVSDNVRPFGSRRRSFSDVPRKQAAPAPIETDYHDDLRNSRGLFTPIRRDSPHASSFRNSREITRASPELTFHQAAGCDSDNQLLQQGGSMSSSMRQPPPMPKERPTSSSSSTRPPSGICKALGTSASADTGTASQEVLSRHSSRPPTAARSPSPRLEARQLAKQPVPLGQDPLGGALVSASPAPRSAGAPKQASASQAPVAQNVTQQPPKPLAAPKHSPPMPPSPRQRRVLPHPSSADAANPKRAKSSDASPRKPSSAELSKRRSGSVEPGRPLRSVPALNDPLLAPRRSGSRGPGAALPVAPPPQTGWASSGREASESSLTGKLRDRAEQVAADQANGAKDREDSLLRMLDRRQEQRVARAVM